MTTDLTTTVVWNHRSYRLTPFRGGWRLRSRVRGNEIDWHFPPCTPDKAREAALARFAGAAPAKTTRGIPSLEDVAEVYLAMPKRAGERSAYNNVTRLRAVVRLALGKELGRVLVTSVGPKLWNAFYAAKQGGKLDLATRRPENVAHNSAVRCASSLFIPRLRPLYAEQGIEIPADATLIQWLPEMKTVKPPAKGDDLLKAWRLHRGTPLYYAVGLARFAGLRQQEAAACRRGWIVRDGNAVYVELRDRPEEGFATKTGEIYQALVINDEFAADLLALAPGFIVQVPEYSTAGAIAKNIKTSRGHWFHTYPQQFLKPFTGRAQKPFHRLRGLYADDVKKLTQDAVAAHLAGVKAASEALGHTSTATTKHSYLSGQ